MALLEGLDTARAEAVGVTAEHKEALEQVWTRITSHFGPTHDAGKLAYGDVEGYIAARRAKGDKGQTIRRDTQALKRAMKAAKRHGMLAKVPDEWPQVRSDAADPKRKGKLHPLPVLLAWLHDLDEDARDEALFDLLTGLRAKELKRAEPSWVEPAPRDSGAVAILRVPAWAAKSRKERVIGLTARAMEIIKRQMAKRKEGETTIFAKASHRTARALACKRIKYNQVITPRDLRHTFATLGVQLTGDAVGTQGALGHSQLAMTQRYQTATLERVAAASSAVDKAVGRVHTKGPHKSKTRQNGGRSAARTHGIQLVRLDPAIVAHLTACNYCQAIVAQCAETGVDPGRKVHTEGPHLAAKRGGR
jgi:integrase